MGWKFLTLHIEREGKRKLQKGNTQNKQSSKKKGGERGDEKNRKQNREGRRKKNKPSRVKKANRIKKRRNTGA